MIWKIGLIIFVLAGLSNAVLIKYSIGGILREGMRLMILTGIAVFVIGLIKISRKGGN